MPARWTNNGGTLPASPPTARRATISPESLAAPSSPRTPARTMPAPSEVHSSSSSGVAPPPLVASLVEAEALLRRAVDDAQEQAATATAAAAAATEAASRASKAAASAAEEAVWIAGATEAVEAATLVCESHAARAEHAAERVEAAAAALAEEEPEGEVEAEEEAAARWLLRPATPLADAASAAALRVPVPLLQIKGPKPSRARKSVAMHVAVPEGPVKLKPRDASVSVEGSRWLLHAVHRPCAYRHRAHTMRTPCAPFCQAAAAYRAQAEAGAASGGRERTARGAAAAPRPVAGAVAALGHRDHIWQ